MAMPIPISRRGFLGATAAAAAISWTAKSYGSIVGANERIRVGFIGAGDMGTNHLNAIADLREQDNLEPVAVADCWNERAEKGAKVVGASLAFTDYRKVLDVASLDYVTIAVPEHWHAQMTLDAMDAGKAVYCEKPMTHTIPEAQSVIRKQRETRLPLQVGVQGMSDDSYIGCPGNQRAYLAGWSRPKSNTCDVTVSKDRGEMPDH